MTALTRIEKEFCLEVTKELQKHELAMVFLEPVDVVRDGVPDYAEKVKNPMDLSTLQSKLENDEYRDASEWKSDLMRIWDNAVRYHGEEQPIARIARKLEKKSMLMTRVIPKTETDQWYLQVLRASDKVSRLIKNTPPTITANLCKRVLARGPTKK